MNQILHIKLRTVLGIACLVIFLLPSPGNFRKSVAAQDRPI